MKAADPKNLNRFPHADRRFGRILMLLLAALFLVGILSLATGSVSISPGRVLGILTGRERETDFADIVLQIRFPRVLTAAVLGGGLSLSGYLLQTYFANPIAGPFVLGISSGAKLAVTGALVLWAGTRHFVTNGMLVLAAFLGAMLVTGLVIVSSHTVHSQSALLVVGIMIGYLCSAGSDFLVTFADDADIVNLSAWSRGSLSGSSWEDLRLAAVLVLILLFLSILLSKPIGALQLGEAYAASMGVNVRLLRLFVILTSSLLSACVTAFAGPISFVGVAVPFLARRLLRTSESLVLIPSVFLCGAVFVPLCDLIARTAFSPLEMSISTVTALSGAPVVIYMMVHRRQHSIRCTQGVQNGSGQNT